MKCASTSPERVSVTRYSARRPRRQLLRRPRPVFRRRSAETTWSRRGKIAIRRIARTRGATVLALFAVAPARGGPIRAELPPELSPRAEGLVSAPVPLAAVIPKYSAAAYAVHPPPAGYAHPTTPTSTAVALLSTVGPVQGREASVPYLRRCLCRAVPGCTVVLQSSTNAGTLAVFLTRLGDRDSTSDRPPIAAPARRLEHRIRCPAAVRGPRDRLRARKGTPGSW